MALYAKKPHRYRRILTVSQGNTLENLTGK